MASTCDATSLQISDETLSCSSDLIEFGLLFDLSHSDGSPVGGGGGALAGQWCTDA